MPITKHKLFIISITKDTGSIDQSALNAIDHFLSETNYLYLNHSITIQERKTSTGTIQGSFLLVSLIYKDLSATEKDLKKVSKRTREVVRKSIAEGEKRPMPAIETDFEKRMKKSLDVKT